MPRAPMTSLSQYMRAERADVTEPASFYVPGALTWITRTLLNGRTVNMAVRTKFGSLGRVQQDSDGERIGPHLIEEELQD